MSTGADPERARLVLTTDPAPLDAGELYIVGVSIVVAAFSAIEAILAGHVFSRCVYKPANLSIVNTAIGLLPPADCMSWVFRRSI